MGWATRGRKVPPVARHRAPEAASSQGLAPAAPPAPSTYDQEEANRRAPTVTRPQKMKTAGSTCDAGRIDACIICFSSMHALGAWEVGGAMCVEVWLGARWAPAGSGGRPPGPADPKIRMAKWTKSIKMALPRERSRRGPQPPKTPSNHHPTQHRLGLPSPPGIRSIL